MLHHVILSFTTLKYRYLMHPQQITQCVCYVITVLYPGIINQMHTFCESLILANGQTGKEEIRTPRHKTHCDQFEKRQFSSSGKTCQPSRSQSPSWCNNSGTSQRRSPSLFPLTLIFLLLPIQTAFFSTGCRLQESNSLRPLPWMRCMQHAQVPIQHILGWIKGQMSEK